MIAPARWAAYRTLRAVSSGRADLARAIAEARLALSDDRDRSLATEIATGTLRWLGALDHLIAQFAHRPVGRLDLEVLDVLRLSAYQLVFLDRVPPAAVVNDGVELTRRIGKGSASTLANAVLRAIAGAKDRLPLPARPPHRDNGAEGTHGDHTAVLDYLSVTLSHPRWLVTRWLERHGFEAAELWARFNNAPVPLTLRANRLKIDPAELAKRLAEVNVEVTHARYAPDGLIVTAGNPLRTPLAGTGLFMVQDEASQLVPLMAAVRPGERVLDTCAAPGGKTIALAADAGHTGRVVAMDMRDRRMALLQQTVAASGASRVALVQGDLARGLPLAPVFDCVMIDAPCSGLGTIRRDPDIRWRRSPGDLAQLAAVELKLLTQAARGVRAGGRLLYATCSSEPEENDDVADAFLDDHSEFEMVDLREVLGAASAGLREVLDERGRLRTLPHRHGLEAFFAVLLRRTR